MGGSKIYRLEQIVKYLNRKPDWEVVISPNDINDHELMWADMVVVQSLVNPRMIADLWAYRVERGKKIITDRDDLLTVQDDNPVKATHKELHAVPWSKELIKVADLVTVTTKTIAAECRQFNHNVHVIPNYLDMETWDIPLAKNETGQIRIGWTGSVTHKEDLRMVLPSLKEVVRRRKNVKLVFCGDLSIGKELADLPRDRYELNMGTSNYYAWSALVHTLALDIAIAPLLDTPFNRARSALKYLEYGMIQAAGVYSPVVFAEVVDNQQTGLLASNKASWTASLLTLVDNKLLRDSIISNAYQDVRTNYSVAKHINKWERLFKTLSRGRRIF